MATTVASGTVSAAIPAGASHTWEDVGGEALWDNAVKEDDQGRIVVAAGDTLAQAIRKRRKRLEQNDYAQRNRRVVRDMIRYLYIVIDASRWMRQKDPVIPPGTRMDVTVQMLTDFVQEYYDQNPLSHLGFVVVKHGEAEILTQLSGNTKTHKMALRAVAQVAASEGPHGGEFSLQNGLEVAGRSLGHQPRHGSREIVIMTAALSTCDPGSILTETLPKLQRANIRVSTFALAAEMHVCRKLAEETHGTIGVCLDKTHFRDWLLGQCVPPPALKRDDDGSNSVACGYAEMVPMGFPTRTSSEVPSLVHASVDKTSLARTAFTCPQCQAKNSELPSDCAVCGLKLVLAPHLARSFHHLFPVAPFVERPLQSSLELDVSRGDKVLSVDNISSAPLVSSSNDGGARMRAQDMSHSLLVSSLDDDRFCYACLNPLGAATSGAKLDGNLQNEGELLRFQCPDCKQCFCVDCDAYLHETLHNCPGCLRCF